MISREKYTQERREGDKDIKYLWEIYGGHSDRYNLWICIKTKIPSSVINVDG
jgi:hypothetical protein